MYPNVIGQRVSVKVNYKDKTCGKNFTQPGNLNDVLIKRVQLFSIKEYWHKFVILSPHILLNV